MKAFFLRFARESHTLLTMSQRSYSRMLTLFPQSTFWIRQPPESTWRELDLFRLLLPDCRFWASVFLPTLASPSARQPNKLKAFKLGMYCLALLVGLSAAAVFGYLAREIPLVLFGANFLKLEELMPWFGGFVCFRYLAAAPGIQLTAHGAQSSRAVITAASLVVTLASVAYLYRDNGQLLSIHLCKSMAIGAFFQFLMYSTALVLVNRKNFIKII